MPCPDDNLLLDFARGGLAPEASQQLERHLSGCELCSAALAEAARQEAAGEPEPAALPPELGRYRVLEPISSGAMGAVYKAYDPKLGRQVALKVLRPDLRGAESADQAQERLSREARSMARLSHPNVVPVFDVGAAGAQVYVAMELVEGGTLRAWLSEQPRSWREVIAAFLQAGRGLAAAHAAGMVHRDFKPDNVLVGGDGRVRVTDFGLARSFLAELEGPASRAAEAPTDASQSGGRVGTPAYMAPEVFRGEPADAWSDQFSFCVCLWEALYRERPFAARSFAELAAAVQHEAPRPPPPDADVPAFVHRALLRGLSRSPADRFPFMESLLRAIDPMARRWMRGLIPAAAAIAMAGLVAGAQLARRPGSSCAESLPPALWSDGSVARIQLAFARSKLAYADPSYSSTHRGLSIASSRLIQRWPQSCLADSDPERACLVQAARRLSEFVQLLGDPEASVIARAPFAARRLADLPCLPVSAPEADAAALARARAALELGLFDQALSLAQPLRDRAGAGAQRALESESLLLLGTAHRGLGASAQARDELERSVLAAEEAGRLELASLAWLELALSGEPGAARHAEALLAARPAWVRQRIELLAAPRGDDVAARRERLLEGLQLAKGTLGDPLLESQLWTELSQLELERSRPADALGQARHALSLAEAELGPSHPSLVEPLLLAGRALSQTGASAEAARTLQRAVELASQQPASTKPLLDALLMLGTIQYGLQRWSEAAATYDRALALIESGAPLPAQEQAWTVANAGISHLKSGHDERARFLLERAVALLEQESVEEKLADAQLALARVLWSDPPQRPRAHRLAKQAREGYARAGAAGPLAEAETWLAERPR